MDDMVRTQISGKRKEWPMIGWWGTLTDIKEACGGRWLYKGNWGMPNAQKYHRK